MITEIASKIPAQLANISGKAFYSGRDAFQVGRPVYLLGYNPGGDPSAHATETIANHTEAVLTRFSSNWSAYRDERWVGNAPGFATFQPVLLQLLASLGLDPGHVPSSNLVFARSARAAHLESPKDLERTCWPFHARAIEMIGPRFIICFGLNTGRLVGKLLGANRVFDRFDEPNDRRWTSDAREAVNGRIVLTLTHPSQAKWTTEATDPRPLVRRVFQERA